MQATGCQERHEFTLRDLDGPSHCRKTREWGIVCSPPPVPMPNP
jgi:hypothetical protein